MSIRRSRLGLLLSLVGLGWALPASATTQQSFDAPGTPYVLAQHAAAPPPGILSGGPTGSFLRVATTATIPQNNSIAFDRSDPGAHCTVTADFDFRMTPVVGRADGMGFALLDTAVYGSTGPVPPQAPLFVAEEPNFQGSLGIGFDIHDNGADDLDDNHVSLHFDGALLTQASAGALDLAGGGFVHAHVVLHAADLLPNVDLVLTPAGGSPVALLTAFPVPGLHPYESRAYFGGRSGGESAHHDLDNVSVSFAGCPAVLGEWSAPSPWPVVAIHAHLLPTGKVLFWDRHDAGGPGNGTPRLWDPRTGLFDTLPEPGPHYDVFCSGHSFLPNGGLLTTGGHIADEVGLPSAVTYDPYSNTWTHHPDMNAGRWYPTNTTLANGDVLVVSGAVKPGQLNDLPQVFQTSAGTWRSLTGAVRAQPLYPFMFLAPDGRVFDAGPEPQTRSLDTAGAGLWSNLAESHSGYRDYGTSAMYADGKVLIAGGSPPDYSATTASAEVIDLAAPAPAWRMVAPMAFARRQLNATLLPDGTVLVTGGTGAAGFNNATGAVLAAELWDPSTESWSTLAGMQVPRLYHSTALLLPDGRVLSAGGGHPNDAEHGDPDHPDAEIYSPPYLFKGPRPTITSAPAEVPYGQSFFVATPDAAGIAAVTWIRLSSVTHAFNQNQRLNRLSFQAVAGGVEVTAPTSPNLAPPGHYLLFLLNGAGVPSVARIVRLDKDLIFGDLGFHTVPPCRLVDTRGPNGPAGGPALQPAAQRTFVLTGACQVPASAKALSVNLTVTQPAAAGDLRFFPAGRTLPLASSINFSAGATRANNALLALPADGTGAVDVQVDSTGTVHLIVDVDGYFQ